MGKLEDIFKIKTCPICGQTFIPTYKYLYKLQNKENQRLYYYCSYTCWRKAGGGNGSYKIRVRPKSEM